MYDMMPLEYPSTYILILGIEDCATQKSINIEI